MSSNQQREFGAELELNHLPADARHERDVDVLYPLVDSNDAAVSRTPLDGLLLADKCQRRKGTEHFLVT